MADANTPPPSPPPANPEGATTPPNPPATPARPDTGFPQHHPHSFHSTPLKPSQNRFLFDPEAGKARRISLVDDTGMGTRFHQLGLNTFNNIIPGNVPSKEVRGQFVAPVMQKKMSELDIGIQLTKTIKSVLDAAGADHGLEALMTSYHKSRGDHCGPEDTYNDIGIYPTTEKARRVTHFLKKDITRSRNRALLKEGGFGRRSWYWMSVLGEIKSEHNQTCAFSMVPTALLPPGVAEGAEPYISGNELGEEGLGQLAEYMHNMLTNQHRCFAYGFYVQAQYARLLYFDRTGAVLSEAFDWSDTSSLLHDFVWKIAHMTPEQLGYDPTARVASESDLDLLRPKLVPDELETLPVEVRQFVLNAFDCTATRPPQEATDAEPSTTDAEPSTKEGKKAKEEVPLDEIPIFKLTVTSSDPLPDEAFPDSPAPSVPSTASTTNGGAPREREFLVGRPHFAAGSLTGRCTRGYIALDVITGEFCFLKDSWRPLVPGRSRPEHLVYQRLRDHQVRRIASLVCGGDVGGSRAQVTKIQNFMPPEKKHVQRAHYRIVIKEVGIPITEFKNFAELAGIFGHALLAHASACQAGILHRDISIGNILIDPATRSGFLIDWDLSRLLSELGDGPMEPDRTGTWQFRSALSLLYPRKPYRVSDDIESFVHAFRYMVLRFHRTKLKGLREHVQGYFEHSLKVGSFRLGGQKKLDYFQSAKPSFKVVANTELQTLLANIAYKCFEFYALVDQDLMESKYGILDDAPASEGSQQQQTDASSSSFKTSTMFNAADEALVLRLHDPADSSSSSQPQMVTQVDACDIENGFLSVHNHLFYLFKGFEGKGQDKHEDQFVLRAGEEPLKIVSKAPSKGIALMSNSRTHDSTQDLPAGSGEAASIAPPSTAATSPSPQPVPESSPAPESPMAPVSVSEDAPEPGPAPLPSSSAQPETRQKRKQQDLSAGKGGTTNQNGGTSGGLSPSKQEPKRPRKGRP